MRRGLVLVVSPARLCASWFAYWALPYKLLSISARDEYAGADLS
jgi:hypothetical protein